MSLNDKQIDVIIIGAGLSGLMAALTLKKNGKGFVVLEAQARVGGRVLSTSYNGSIIDLGAQSISPQQKRIQKLLKDYGLSTTLTHKKGTTLYALRGKKKIGKGQTPPFTILSLLDLYALKCKLRVLLKKVDAAKPWESDDAKNLDTLTLEQWLENEMFSQFGRTFYRVISEEGICSDLSEVSLLDVLWEMKSTGSLNNFSTAEDSWISDGAQTLAKYMAEDLADAIKLNESVKYIQWNSPLVRVVTNNREWLCKKVIIAIPPAFTNQIKYEPSLPAERDLLCKSICQGFVIKCVIVYRTPFWRNRGESGITYYDKGPVMATMDSSTIGQKEGVLTAVVTGNDAQRLGELKEEFRKEEVLTCLSYLFGKEALKPVAYFEKDWSADPWARGGYAGHFAPGVLTQFGDALIRPIGPIHWAGSETAFEWRLYMEGALEAGERAALEVITKINETNAKKSL
jgi:monoamine oxidase